MFLLSFLRLRYMLQTVSRISLFAKNCGKKAIMWNERTLILYDFPLHNVRQFVCFLLLQAVSDK